MPLSSVPVKMATVTSPRVRTRSRKVISPDVTESTADQTVTQSSEVTSSDLRQSDNENLNATAVETRTRSYQRKRRRVESDESEDENEKEEQKLTKRTRTAVKNTKTKKQASRKKAEPRGTGKKRSHNKKQAIDSSDEAESLSEKESGVASSYSLSSSLSSSAESDKESDSPVPTSELSDSSPDFDSSTYESSGDEDVTWRIRKSPRKQAQMKSRKKIAELCIRNSDSENSTTSTESSFVSDD